MAKKKKTKIAVSTASLLVSFGPWGPLVSWILAKMFGFDGLQILPLRGWNARWLKLLPDEFVLTVNGHPWNYGPLKEVFRRHRNERLGIKVTPEDKPPLVWDWLFFGSLWLSIRRRLDEIKVAYPDALWITHDLESEGIFEPNPEALLTHLVGGGDWESFQARMITRELALDPHHLGLRRDWYGRGKRVTNNLLQFIKHQNPDMVPIVHVNPSGDLDDFDKWLAGEQSFFAEILEAIVSMLDGRGALPPLIVVVETPPKPKYIFRLKEIQQRIREAFEPVI